MYMALFCGNFSLDFIRDMYIWHVLSVFLVYINLSQFPGRSFARCG